MADAYWTVDRARISDVSCGWTRRALLALEPGSRVWMDVNGTPILLERVAKGTDASGVPQVAPADGSRETWLQLFTDAAYPMQEIEFIERPADAGRGVNRWFDAEDATV